MDSGEKIQTLKLEVLGPILDHESNPCQCSNGPDRFVAPCVGNSAQVSTYFILSTEPWKSSQIQINKTFKHLWDNIMISI